MTANQLIKATETNLLTQAHKTLPQATAAELHNALSAACMEALAKAGIALLSNDDLK